MGRPQQCGITVADQVRMRRDLHVLIPEGELTAELRMMAARRTDLVKEPGRKTNRLHAQVLSLLPPGITALIRALSQILIAP
ncbi:transposase [Streptomyces sp. NPDC046909]|uniref:IS110 family transposase n=1 Tax=Streptomyces sp. NPDC046909 TaxID=3155617 RepID=UPI0033DDAC29